MLFTFKKKGERALLKQCLECLLEDEKLTIKRPKK